MDFPQTDTDTDTDTDKDFFGPHQVSDNQRQYNKKIFLQSDQPSRKDCSYSCLGVKNFPSRDD